MLPGDALLQLAATRHTISQLLPRGCAVLLQICDVCSRSQHMRLSCRHTLSQAPPIPRLMGCCCTYAVTVRRGRRDRQHDRQARQTANHPCHYFCCMRSFTTVLLWCTADAHKTGVAQEAAKTATKVAKGISPQEARQILHVDPQASWVDVTKVGTCGH
jgi:hypothetical protein